MATSSGVVVRTGRDVVAVEPPPVSVVQVPPASPSGHLVVSAGLDRTAVLHGRESERFLTVTVDDDGVATVLVRYPLGGSIRDLTYDAGDRITRYTHYDRATAAPQPAPAPRPWPGRAERRGFRANRQRRGQ